MQATISTIATLVSICGGIVGIYSSLRGQPVRQAPAPRTLPAARQAQPARPEPPSGYNLPTPAPQSALTPAGPGARQRHAPFALLLAIVVCVLALLTISGLRAYFDQASGGSSYDVATLLALSGLAMLAIVAGLLPARRGAPLGVVAPLGIVLALAVIVGLVLATIIPSPDYTFTGTDLMLLAIFGVASLAITLVAGRVGKALCGRALRQGATRLAS